MIGVSRGRGTNLDQEQAVVEVTEIIARDLIGFFLIITESLLYSLFFNTFLTFLVIIYLGFVP